MFHGSNFTNWYKIIAGSEFAGFFESIYFSLIDACVRVGRDFLNFIPCELQEQAMTPKEIIEQQIPVALGKKPELILEINAVIHFNITGDNGGQWTMDLTKESDWVSQGLNGEPKLTVTVSDKDFVKLRKGELNGTMAVMMGKLQFKPMDLNFATKVAKLLG